MRAAPQESVRESTTVCEMRDARGFVVGPLKAELRTGDEIVQMLDNQT